MDKLPVDIVLEYIGLLGHEELINLCKVNKKMNEICKDHKDYISKKALEHIFNIKVDVKDALLIYKTLERRDLLVKYKVPSRSKNPEIMYPNNFYGTLSGLLRHDNEKVNIIKSFIFKIFDGGVYVKHEVFDDSKQVYLVYFDKKTNPIKWLNKYFGKILPKKEFYFLLDDPTLSEDLDEMFTAGELKGYMRLKHETKFEYFGS